MLDNDEPSMAGEIFRLSGCQREFIDGFGIPAGKAEVPGEPFPKFLGLLQSGIFDYKTLQFCRRHLWQLGGIRYNPNSQGGLLEVPFEHSGDADGQKVAIIQLHVEFHNVFLLFPVWFR